MFRFTIRDVLRLMVVVAVCATWWLDRSKLQQHAVRAESLHGDDVTMLDS